MATLRVILDTDIGTNPDDCLALALALASPELDLVAVTTVHGDVALRARIALKLLHLARGSVEVPPVAAGASRPLLRERPMAWGGHEGEGLLEPGDEALQPTSQSAADLIVNTVMAHPRQITLVAIGPLTNVAQALEREPRLMANLSGLILMGGVVGGAGGLHLPWTEHNFASDPEAAQLVLQAVPAGFPLTIIPLDVTRQVYIRQTDVDRIASKGGDYAEALARQVTLYPPFARRGWGYLHDPLALAALIEPSLVKTEMLHAVVETGGEFTSGKLLVALPGPDALPTARVALLVNAPRAERFILDRLQEASSQSH